MTLKYRPILFTIKACPYIQRHISMTIQVIYKSDIKIESKLTLKGKVHPKMEILCKKTFVRLWLNP